MKSPQNTWGKSLATLGEGSQDGALFAAGVQDYTREAVDLNGDSYSANQRAASGAK